MPGKHHASLASHPRILLSAVLGVVLIAALLLWSAARNRDLDPPLMIMPALGAATAPSAATPAPTPTAVPSSRPPSPRATTKVSASPSPSSPSPSPSPSSRPPSQRPSASPTPAAESAFAARYLGGTERRGRFQAGLVIENVGRAAGEWEVRVSFADRDRVRIQHTYGARASRSGDTVTFRGGPLEPGRSTMIGFQASTTGDGEIRPTSCQVDGRACTISFR